MSITENEIIEWRPWPRDPRYIIGADGTVIGPKGVRKPQVNTHRDNHSHLNIRPPGTDRRNWKVSHIVCETFNGPRPGPEMQAAHEDGNTLNNSAGNLSWKTAAENAADKFRHGTIVRGEKNYNARLTEELVREIRARRATGERYKSIAGDLGLNRWIVSEAARGVTWRHVL